MLEIVNQLDGFDSRGNIKVWLAAGRIAQLPAPSSLARLTWCPRIPSPWPH